MSEETMSMSSFAQLRGVSRKSVQRWVAKGHVLLDDAGRVRVDVSNEQLDSRPAVYRGGRLNGNPRRRDPLAMSIVQANAMKEHFLALSAKLKYEQSAARLCEIDAVLPVIKADYAAVRERCMKISGDAAAAIAARPVWPNAEECKNLIDATVIKALDELTDDSAFEGDRPH